MTQHTLSRVRAFRYPPPLKQLGHKFVLCPYKATLNFPLNHFQAIRLRLCSCRGLGSEALCRRHGAPGYFSGYWQDWRNSRHPKRVLLQGDSFTESMGRSKSCHVLSWSNWRFISIVIYSCSRDLFQWRSPFFTKRMRAREIILCVFRQAATTTIRTTDGDAIN